MRLKSNRMSICVFVCNLGSHWANMVLLYFSKAFFLLFIVEYKLQLKRGVLTYPTLLSAPRGLYGLCHYLYNNNINISQECFSKYYFVTFCIYQILSFHVHSKITILIYALRTRLLQDLLQKKDKAKVKL